MVKWISEEWYPGLSHVLPHTLNSSEFSNPKKMCYEGIIPTMNSILNYDQNGKWLVPVWRDGTSCNKYSGRDPSDPACCLGADRLGSFADLQMPTLQTAADLDDYLDHFDYNYADAGGPGLMWGAVVFHSLGSTDGSPGKTQSLLDCFCAHEVAFVGLFCAHKVAFVGLCSAHKN